MSVLVVGACALTACGQAPQGPGTPSARNHTACLVSDQGGFDDRSFTQAAHEGLKRAEAELGVRTFTVQSTAEIDYGPNIDGLVGRGCDLIIGAGHLLEDSIQVAAVANPGIDFALIDSAFTDETSAPVVLANARPILFDTAQASFLAGYLAAGMTRSGTVATFGGLQLPSVTLFMDGFVDGVARYNEDNGTGVQVLGWRKDTQTGSFTGDFSNQANGQTTAKGFIDQGADIIMPVAGSVGLGAAAAARESGQVAIIWVDSDGYETTQYGNLMLTSVTKDIGPVVFDTVQASAADGFRSDPYLGTLANEGVGLAPWHDFDGRIPADLKARLDELQAQIISGDLIIESPSTPRAG